MKDLKECGEIICPLWEVSDFGTHRVQARIDPTRFVVLVKKLVFSLRSSLVRLLSRGRFMSPGGFIIRPAGSEFGILVKQAF